MNRVVVVGAGRQGPAAAYDLARSGAADHITLADFDLGLAQSASLTVNGLLGREVCVAARTDAGSSSDLESLLEGHVLAIAAAPYRLNPNVCLAGLKVGCHVADMGLDTVDALDIHAKSATAKARAISIVTDCGVAPGLVNVLAYRLLKEVSDATKVSLYCGGLPEHADPPYFHRVGFSVESLIGEYVDEVDSLRGGRVVREEALGELEKLDIPGLGPLEAVTTSGGTGTAAHNLAGRVQDYVYKTLRYPGHWAVMRFLRDAGFWSEDPLPHGGVPLHVTSQLMERDMVVPQDRDIVIARVVAKGPGGAKGYDVVDRYDPATGFTAMQRTTGFSTAIVAAQILAGNVKPGCRSCEEAVSPDTFFNEAAKRGIEATPTMLEGQYVPLDVN